MPGVSALRALSSEQRARRIDARRESLDIFPPAHSFRVDPRGSGHKSASAPPPRSGTRGMAREAQPERSSAMPTIAICPMGRAFVACGHCRQSITARKIWRASDPLGGHGNTCSRKHLDRRQPQRQIEMIDTQKRQAEAILAGASLSVTPPTTRRASPRGRARQRYSRRNAERSLGIALGRASAATAARGMTYSCLR